MVLPVYAGSRKTHIKPFIVEGEESEINKTGGKLVMKMKIFRFVPLFPFLLALRRPQVKHIELRSKVEYFF